MEPLRVLIVAEDPLTALGAASLLEPFDDLVAVVPGEDPAFDLVAELVLWLPGPFQWEGEPVPLELDLPVLALVSGNEDADRALALGVSGVLTRTVGPEALAAALRATAEGLEVFEAGLRSPAGEADEERAAPAELTPRELEVLRLVVEGHTNKAIASELELSPSTVKFHLNALLGKFGAQTRTELAVQAIRLGLVAI